MGKSKTKTNHLPGRPKGGDRRIGDGENPSGMRTLFHLTLTVPSKSMTEHLHPTLDSPPYLLCSYPPILLLF